MKKEELKKQELMAAIVSNSKSFDEIMTFLKDDIK